MTYYDHYCGSLVSGTKEQWNAISKLLLNNLDKNLFFSLMKIYNVTKPNIAFSVQNSELVENIATFNETVCERASSKLFLRLHKIDLMAQNLDSAEPQIREALLVYWLRIYRSTCWSGF